MEIDYVMSERRQVEVLESALSDEVFMDDMLKLSNFRVDKVIARNNEAYKMIVIAAYSGYQAGAIGACTRQIDGMNRVMNQSINHRGKKTNG